jgi:hypothetical protein
MRTSRGSNGWGWHSCTTRCRRTDRPRRSSYSVATVTSKLAAIAIVLLAALPVPAQAQAPTTAPLIMHLPSSARTAALGNAWVAGRDQDVIFYNPAQLVGAGRDFAVSLSRPATSGTALSAASAYAAGRYSLTLGWGAQMIGFNPDPLAPYPYSTDVLLTRGGADGQSMLLAFGGAFAYKGTRVGAATKYISDRASTPAGANPAASITQHAWVVDVGVARNMLGGVLAFSAQNLGRSVAENPADLTTPQQFLAGYSMTKPAGPFDVGLYGQVTMRPDWIAPAAGVEMGYSWLEGYTVTLRAGARRPETDAEQPVSLGAGVTVDRLTVEYGVQFVSGGRASHGVTVRWR